MTEITIVEVGPEDWQVFRVLRLAALREAPYAFGSRYEDWVDAPEERWRGRLDQVRFNVVAHLDGIAAGLASGREDGDRIELVSMWVAPDARRHGVARRLIDAVVDWAARLGRTTYLMVRVDNASAISVYRALGFTDQGIPEDQNPSAPPERLMVRGSEGPAS